MKSIRVESHYALDRDDVSFFESMDVLEVIEEDLDQPNSTWQVEMNIEVLIVE